MLICSVNPPQKFLTAAETWNVFHVLLKPERIVTAIDNNEIALEFLTQKHSN